MIYQNVKQVLQELPDAVELVGAAKGRTPVEILEAIDAGLRIIGENYVEETEKCFAVIGKRVKWHMIGHLQSRKVKKAVQIFDLIETVDSVKLASSIDRACREIEKTMPILIEINSAEEEQKAGVMPLDAVSLIKEISGLENIHVMGLMTMGRYEDDPEAMRRYFSKTKRLFDDIRAMDLPGVTMMFLSMGMSDSYQIAIQEGANIVRIGTRLFGERISIGFC
jgi:PLP dependent protein